MSKNLTVEQKLYDNFGLGNDCFKFGSWFGCKEECPVFQRDECEVWEEVLDSITDTKKDKLELGIEYGYIKDSK